MMMMMMMMMMMSRSVMFARSYMQLRTVTSVLMIQSDEEFGFQITTERGRNVAAA